MMATSTLFVELKREIFEISAREYPQEAAKLLRVAKRVHQWILPFVYSTIRSDRKATREAMDRAVRSEYPNSSFPFDLVRHLYVARRYNQCEDWYYPFLAKCPNIISFGNTAHPSATRLLPLLEGLADLRYWNSAAVGEDPEKAYIRMDLTHPAFRNLTHIHLFTALPEEDVTTLVALSRLPRLTHLALNQPPGRVVVQLLKDCPLLRVLIHRVFGAHDRDKYLAQGPHDDPRYVLSQSMWGQTYWDQWVAGTYGRADM